MSRADWLRVGLLLGLGAGAWDAIGVIVENPRSFPDLPSAVGFTGATLALSLVLGALGAVAAGLLVGIVPARVRPFGRGTGSGPAGGARVRPCVVVAVGLAVWLFLFFGIRVHVRFLFGEPLLSARSLGVDALVLVLAAAIAFASLRLFGRRLDALVRSTLPFRLVGVVFAAAMIATGATLGRSGPSRAAGDPPAGARDVLLVTLDTTRADHLSCYGYPRGTTPAIDRLARTGWLARGVQAPIPLTNPAHCSLFTGLLPREHGVLNNGMALPDSIPTVVEELAAHGFRCAAFVSGIPLKESLSGLGGGFAHYDDVFSPLERIHPMMTTLAVVRVANRLLPVDFIERRAVDTCAAAIRWLEESAAGAPGADAPRFVWVHLFDPHTPYDAPAPLRARFARESPAWSAHGEPVTGWPIADYDAELAEADRHLEDLLRVFRDVTGGAGAVFVTADHGEGLGEHGELAHGTQLFAEDLTVPFLGSPAASAPAPESFPITLRANTAGPAIAAWTLRGTERVALPSALPILGETFAPEGRENKSCAIGYRGDSGGIGKLVVNWATGEELAFRLDEDPGETRPVDATGPEWDALRGALSASALQGATDLDAVTAERLRALGYIH